MPVTQCPHEPGLSIAPRACSSPRQDEQTWCVSVLEIFNPQPQSRATESSHRVPDSSGVRERGVHLCRLVAWRGPALDRWDGKKGRCGSFIPGEY
ncbi:hypothetical protein CesoFtcFv8_000980 [Champsocephalus esox]|uniref:Uncharacterized protein n=1 Tax=Champsocephalus esox TaxID=159716 RepID=A0AAN8D3T5_9TELE|nr:hypothetical protein CesoFtcFv8_000980 [Champsocephalus esox]